MRQLPLKVRLPAHAVFESFSIGGNAEVLAALKAAFGPPLWLYGAHGLGKTHLLQAACAAAGTDGAYFPLSADERPPPEALQGFERVRVLCLDDADEVAGSTVWERALFQLYNAAAESGTRLIFGAAAAPRQIGWALDDWRSRAAASVVYQMRELDDAARMEALRLRAKQRGLVLPDETADYLVKRVPRDLPSLCRILDELDEASLVAQRRLTIPFIRAALETHVGTQS
ncbi:MAG TPA: DnaA regulatory inactivator Hda [Steroidobacteraceae bacterium]|jgi:DnaA family protein